MEFTNFQDFQQHLAFRLLTYRLEHNMSQKYMADFLGISPVTLSKLENCHLSLSFETVFHLCEKLGSPLHIIL
ncbi:MAG: helix-turn-helix domain-containing protein [Candidatus Fimimorpha sp.]